LYRRGTVLEIQAAMKKTQYTYLDKHRSSSGCRHSWKEQVAIILRNDTARFEKTEKTATGFWIYKLKAPQPQP
jgi:hypothetical protein